MLKKLNGHHRINRRHLILGLVLNILVIIVAFIIYHLTFNTPQKSYTPITPRTNLNLQSEIPYSANE